MAKTPQLEQMGITRPEEISRYKLRQVSPQLDVLKIYYAREPGSFLPVSRTYQFGRSLKTSIADSGKPEYADTHEVSPALLAAVGELDALLERKHSSDGQADHVAGEIAALARKLRTASLEDLGAISNRLDQLRDRLLQR